MKNPFAMMATMAAAMAAAFRENAYREADIALPDTKKRSRIPGKENPAGSKLLKRYYKAHHGYKPTSIEEAKTWYHKVHK